MILTALRKTGHADLQTVEVHVADGLVGLSGTVSSFFSKQTAQVVAAAAADQPGTYFALGYGGTMSVTAARIIAGLYAGRDSSGAHLFRFDR